MASLNNTQIKMAESAATNTGLKLAGKVAMVTGGAGGIGETTARVFADHGARMVVIADIQDELGKQIATSIGSDKCSYVHCDVADEDQVRNLVQSTVNMYGQLDIMFSNAGILSPSEPTILDIDITQLSRLFAVNACGMAACVKHAALAMVEKKVRGSIICTASVSASYGGTGDTDYVMSKHAVIGLMRAASIQLGGYGIRVNSVSPNGLATPMTCERLGSEEKVQEAYEKCAWLKGLFLTTKHVADAVLFLASDDSEFISGHDLLVDGSYIVT